MLLLISPVLFWSTKTSSSVSRLQRLCLCALMQAWVSCTVAGVEQNMLCAGSTMSLLGTSRACHATGAPVQTYPMWHSRRANQPPGYWPCWLSSGCMPPRFDCCPLSSWPTSSLSVNCKLCFCCVHMMSHVRMFLAYEASTSSYAHASHLWELPAGSKTCCSVMTLCLCGVERMK